MNGNYDKAKKSLIYFVKDCSTFFHISTNSKFYSIVVEPVKKFWFSGIQVVAMELIELLYMNVI